MTQENLELTIRICNMAIYVLMGGASGWLIYEIIDYINDRNNGNK